MHSLGRNQLVKWAMFFPVSKREPVRRSVVEKTEKERKEREGGGAADTREEQVPSPGTQPPLPQGAYFNKGTKV